MKKLSYAIIFFLALNLSGKAMAQSNPSSLPTTSMLFFKEATVTIELPDSWKNGKKQSYNSSVSVYPFFESKNSFSKMKVSIFRLQGKDPKKTAKSLIALAKRTGQATGTIQLVEDTTTPKKGFMVHTVHTPKTPSQFQKKLDRIRIIYWGHSKDFLLSCQIKLEQKDKAKFRSLVRACTTMKVKLKKAPLPKSGAQAK